MFQAKLPYRFWRHCILTAKYLINRLPNSAVQFRTPYELLFHKSPSYEHLKVFGCLGFLSTPKHSRTKFDPRAHPCVFLGYPTTKKAYKIFNLVTRKVQYSRDLVFHENYFPFHHLSSSDTILPNSMFLSTSTPDYYPDCIPTPQDVFQSAPAQLDVSVSPQQVTSSSQPDISPSQQVNIPSSSSQEVFPGF